MNRLFPALAFILINAAHVFALSDVAVDGSGRVLNNTPIDFTLSGIAGLAGANQGILFTTGSGTRIAIGGVDFATAAQGALAASALQPGGTLTNPINSSTIQLNGVNLGTAALSDTSSFATAAQGALAATALQPNGNGSSLTGITPGQIGAATAAQGALAASALQPNGNGSSLTGITPSQVGAATAAQGTLASSALQPNGNGSGLTNLTAGNIVGTITNPINSGSIRVSGTSLGTAAFANTSAFATAAQGAAAIPNTGGSLNGVLTIATAGQINNQYGGAIVDDYGDLRYPYPVNASVTDGNGNLHYGNGAVLSDSTGAVHGNGAALTSLNAGNITTGTLTVPVNASSLQVGGTSVGSAAFTSSSAYATAAQGTLAASALQPNGSGSTLTSLNASNITSGTLAVPINASSLQLNGTSLGSAAFTSSTNYVPETNGTLYGTVKINGGSLSSATTLSWGLSDSGGLAVGKIQDPALNFSITSQNGFYGNGSQLFSLNAANITTGTLTAPINTSSLEVNGTSVGSAAFTSSSNYATATQGTLAVSALQPNGNGSSLTNLNASNITSGTLTVPINTTSLLVNGSPVGTTNASSLTSGTLTVPVNTSSLQVNGTNVGSAAFTASTAYATAAQGTLAASALQPNGNGSGLTNLNASNITSGFLPISSLAGYPGTSNTYLTGNGTWVNPATLTTGTQTGSYTLQSTDNGTVITVNATSSPTITIPSTLVNGFNVTFIQTGTTQVVFAAGSGMTLRQRSGFTKTAGQWGVATLIVNGTNGVMSGDMSN